MPLWAFRVGDVFDPDDPLAVWMCTLAVALNDAVHANIKTDEATREWERLYEWRVAIAHYNEACLHLERGAEFQEVKDFVASEPQLQNAYDDVLSRYHELRPLANRIRNQAAFHYPYKEGRKAMIRALRDLVDTEGTMGGVASNKMRDSRQFYADELVAMLVWKASGGSEESYKAAAATLGEAVASFGRFANAALDAFFYRHPDALRRQAGT
jgi:hypothetical protein